MSKDGGKRKKAKKPSSLASDSAHPKGSNVSQFVPRKTRGVTYNPNKIYDVEPVRKYSTSSVSKQPKVDYFNNTKKPAKSKGSDALRGTVNKPNPKVRTNPNISLENEAAKKKKNAPAKPQAKKRSAKPSYKNESYVIRTSDEGVIRIKEQPARADKKRRTVKPEERNIPRERVKKVKQKKVVSPEVRKLRRERARKALRYVFLVFLLAVLCAGAYVASSLLFKIESITVSGNVRFESDYIIRLSGLNIGDNLLFLDTKGAQDSISQNPYITAKITRKLPNQIVITVTERSECAVIVTKTGYATMDIEGNVLSIESDNPLPTLVRITGMETSSLQVGKRIAPLSDYRASTLLKLISEIISGEYYAVISEINMANPLAIEMLAKSNYPVYFGDTENCAKKLENLKRILNEISDLGTGRIDVSCVDKPAFIPDSDATPSPTDESPSATPESTAIPTETPQVSHTARPTQTPNTTPAETPIVTPEETPDETPEETAEQTPEP